MIQTLAHLREWKTNRGGTLAKSAANRLQKDLLLAGANDPLLPPQPESLYYELLRGLGAAEANDQYGTVNAATAERIMCDSTLTQVSHWMRAWMRCDLWQDGIGTVPDRDRREEATRIPPASLRQARELLVWALSRLALGPDDHWLDLETFLIGLRELGGKAVIDFYWSAYQWQPDFPLAKDKRNIKENEARQLAYWLADQGTWVANAIMGTLAHLGVVERGGTAPKQRPCFRLTAIGRTVFGPLGRQVAKLATESTFLTVQPNHEIMAFLDGADAGHVGALARIAQRTSALGSRVQTFALTRDSLYRGLESGMSPEKIEGFLRDHSKTEIPAVVSQSLRDWSARREALVIRSDVALAIRPPDNAHGRAVGEHFVLLSTDQGRVSKSGKTWNHLSESHRCWLIDDQGGVTVTGSTNAIVRARLAQFAEPDGIKWRITSSSVCRARDRGIASDQVLDWLREHAVNEVPPIVETSIRNWSGRAQAFLGNLLLLQICDQQACEAVRNSPRFQPFLVEFIPPNWFVIQPNDRKALGALLAEIGFDIDQTKPAFSSAEKPTRTRRRSRG